MAVTRGASWSAVALPRDGRAKNRWQVHRVDCIRMLVRRRRIARFGDTNSMCVPCFILGAVQGVAGRDGATTCRFSRPCSPRRRLWERVEW